MMYIILPVVYTMPCFLGVLLNVLNLKALTKSKKHNSNPRNCLICCLFASDIVMCLFTAPFLLWYTLQGHWPFGSRFNWLCKALVAAQHVPILLSSMHILTIACDRFRFITQSHKRQLTKIKVCKLSIYLFTDFTLNTNTHIP